MPRGRPPRYVPEAGQRFGSAVVEVPDIWMQSPGESLRPGRQPQRRRGCLMRCDCGTFFAAQVHNVVHGRQPSCGMCDFDQVIARRAVENLLAGHGFELVRLELRPI